MGSESPTNIRTLLIEDNPGDARLIREHLRYTRDAHFGLETAGTLQEGLEKLEASNFDIILLDLSLPDSFGLSAIEKLRAQHPSIPMVVLTGLDDDAAGTQAVQMGAQDYLIKNKVTDVLLQRSMRYAIERFRVEDALRRSEEEYRSLITDVFNNSFVGVVIIDANFKVVWVNEALLQYFGLPREAVEGNDKRVLIHEKLKCVFQDPDIYEKNLLDDYDAHTFQARFECLVLPADGREERWLEYWSQPITSGIYAGGRIEHYADITARKRAEIAEREQQILTDALRDAASLLADTLNLDEVLDRILENLERAVFYNHADILLLNENEASVVRSSSHNVGQPAHVYLLDRTMFLTQMLVSRTYLLENNIPYSNLWANTSRVAEFGSYLGTPIVVKNEVIGFISIYSRSFNQYDAVDAERLQIFAGYAAIALENARLYRSSQQLAAFQERQRLARELHDSVSQTLFTTSVMSESALRQWTANPDRAQHLLTEVHKLTRGALAEMRVLLLELRPRSLEQSNFNHLMELLAQSVQGRNVLEIELSIDDLPTLSADVKIGLYRITQEALNNVVKHSTATQVMITVQNLGDVEVLLRISDNGQGFELDEVSGSSLGLGIMRERADAMQANLTIESVPGQGTTVTVRSKLTNQ